MIDRVAAYLAGIAQAHQKGDATEYTFRPALKALLEAFDPAIIATNEPARQRCGAPDYILTKEERPLGYIETKTIGKHLDAPEFKEQLDRYKAALPNLIITNYTRFQFYRDTQKIAEIDIAEVKDRQIKPLRENFAEFENLFRDFCNFKGATIHDAHQLAQFLADKAKLLADTIRNVLTIEDNDYDNQSLQEQLKSFHKVLIPTMSAAMFSDLYAQTVTYGMFVGRLHHKTADIFTRYTAAERIPKSHPFLRNLFSYIAGPSLDDRIRWVIDGLADLLQVTNIKLIMENFGKETQTEDATIHFYEDFLTAYNPDLRKTRGVFYTPQPAVGYIVRAVDDILRQDFDLPDGIADNTKVDIDKQQFHKVQILDPATGTGTFLAEVIRHIHAHIVAKNMQGAWNNYAANDLLPRLHGFEILMAPYAMAHLKLDMILEDTGYRFEKNQRVGVYLTNSLEEGIKIVERFGFIKWLTDESEGATRIKIELPVMVVLGNPPYNVSTMNKSKFAETLIEQYKKGEGVDTERNIQPLSDDYIKFIALGQHFIEKNPSRCGILAYISNNTFLDGLIHRQMRKSLLETFDTIYIINLHGNARRKETTPDGGKDENIFNIMQGTSINIFVRSPKKKEGTLGKVFYADLYGKRQEKFNFLSSKKLKRTGYAPLKPVAPYYFFVPKDFSAQKEYEKGFCVNDLFVINTSGVETKRDSLFIDNDRETLIKRIQTLLFGNYDWRFEDKYRVEDTNGYEIKRLLKGKKFKYQFVQQIEYRPFDLKWIYYDPDLLARAFYSTMQHIVGKENFGLIAKRGFEEPNAAPAFVSKYIIDRRSWSRPGMQGAEQFFPLYLYPPLGEKQPNLNSDIVTKIEQIIGKNVKPEKLFDYVYGVLHSPEYRTKYQEFLKIDFPRIPYPVDSTEFERFAKIGTKLRELHLLEKVPKVKTTFPIADGNVIENVRFVDGKVFINETQYFGNVPESAWEFYIGGYQPLQKYLKDRKGRVLTFEEIQHYQKIVAVLLETVLLQREM